MRHLSSKSSSNDNIVLYDYKVRTGTPPVVRPYRSDGDVSGEVQRKVAGVGPKGGETTRKAYSQEVTFRQHAALQSFP